MDLTKFILPTKLVNTDVDEFNFYADPSLDDQDYDSNFNTEDLVYLDSCYYVEKEQSDFAKVIYPTDYAIMNNALMSRSNQGPKGRKSCWTWLRSAYSSDEVYEIALDGDLDSTFVNITNGGICPALHLNLSSVISARKNHSDLFRIYIKGLDGSRTIEFGEYPKTYVGNKKNKELEKLFYSRRLAPTGKKYIGRDCSLNYEFEYEGQKFVRVLTKRYDEDSKFSDRTMAPEYETYLWAKVEPIVWKIRNWDELPKEINPNGNGKASFIDIRTEEAIISGIPFYPNADDENGSLWQNSTIRGYLNGINVNNIKTNGNTEYTAPKGGDFTGKNNFLTEAFNIDLQKMFNETEEDLETEVKEPTRKKSRLEKLNPDKTLDSSRRKMTDTEIIKSWIDAGQSVLLRGPSGIGKTERIKKLYPDLIYIKLTNNMFPEKVVGSVNLQTGESIPPDFAKQAILSCANEQEKKLITENIQNLYDLADTIYERSKTAKGKTVIMLDELLNVKPAVQSLVYTLVLNKIVETGKGLKLPANTVVVATGNQKKYSNVAEDLAEPLEKRFDHILDMEPKVGEWIYEYAIPNKIHPSVVGYLFNKYQQNRKNESLSKIGYFYEEPEIGEKHLDKNGCRGRTNDPRGWTSISNTLYAFEEDLQKGKFVGKNVEDLLKVTINSKLREEWAEEFVDFYNHPTLTVEEVANKKYSQVDLPTNINEKFACLAGLLSADENQVGACREFIRKYCDPEYLSVYDLYWAGNDEKRIEKLVEIQEMEVLNKNDLEL